MSLTEYFTSSATKRSGAKMEAAAPTPELSKKKTKKATMVLAETMEAVEVPTFVKNDAPKEPMDDEDKLMKEFEYNEEGNTEHNALPMELDNEEGKPASKLQSRAKSGERSQSHAPAAKDKDKDGKDKWELPTFIRPENIVDKHKRKPSDPMYDPTSVFVPESEYPSMTPTVRQYWQIKKDNMDKIVLFKLGKFYELFNEDAAICHKLLDLNWTGPLHVGFPEKCLDKYGSILVNAGYKVIVAEQMETPKEMKKRLQHSKNKKDDKTIKREVCQVMTKGLYVDPTHADYEAKYILSIYTDHTTLVGVAILDIAALKIKIGQFEDDKFWCKFRTLCTRLRPVEVLYNRDGLRPELRKILQNSPILPVFSPLPPDKGCYNYIRTVPQLEKYFGPDTKVWPQTLATAKANLWQNAIAAFGVSIGYLEDCLLAKQVVATAEYEIFDLDTSLLFTMTLDSQALQHLEVLEVQGMTKNTAEGSLLHYLDKTRTPFGHREMKRWLCAPLYDITDIRSRQDAVADFLGNPALLSQLRDKLARVSLYYEE